VQRAAGCHREFDIHAVSAHTVKTPPPNGGLMSVARVVEISSTSTKSFEDAISEGISRASKTLREIKSAWVKEQEVRVQDGKIVAYQVNMLVTFVLEGEA
jgi:dodecin